MVIDTGIEAKSLNNTIPTWFMNLTDIPQTNSVNKTLSKYHNTVFWNTKESEPFLIDLMLTFVNDCTNLQIKEVIFHAPATIIYWQDRSKTVVVDKNIHKVIATSEENDLLSYISMDSEGNKHRKETSYKQWKYNGLTNCMLKKLRGNGYIDELLKWC